MSTRTPNAKLLALYMSSEFKDSIRSNVELYKMKIKLHKLKIKAYRESAMLCTILERYPEDAAAGVMNMEDLALNPMGCSDPLFGPSSTQRKIQDQKQMIEDHIKGVVYEDPDSDEEGTSE